MVSRPKERIANSYLLVEKISKMRQHKRIVWYMELLNICNCFHLHGKLMWLVTGLQVCAQFE